MKENSSLRAGYLSSKGTGLHLPLQRNEFTAHKFKSLLTQQNLNCQPNHFNPSIRNDYTSSAKPHTRNAKGGHTRTNVGSMIKLEVNSILNDVRD